MANLQHNALARIIQALYSIFHYFAKDRRYKCPIDGMEYLQLQNAFAWGHVIVNNSDAMQFLLGLLVILHTFLRECLQNTIYLAIA